MLSVVGAAVMNHIHTRRVDPSAWVKGGTQKSRVCSSHSFSTLLRGPSVGKLPNGCGNNQGAVSSAAWRVCLHKFGDSRSALSTGLVRLSLKALHRMPGTANSTHQLSDESQPGSPVIALACDGSLVAWKRFVWTSTLTTANLRSRFH